MKLSNGYTYMLSILQFLNSLSNKFEVILICLDTENEIDDYFNDVLGEKKSKNLRIYTQTNTFFGIKSNKIFFFYNLKKIIKSYKEDILIYSRDLKQMRLALKSFRDFENVHFVFETHQILSENYMRNHEFKNSRKSRALEMYIYQNTNILVSITETLKKDIEDKFLNITKNHYVLPLGFNKKFMEVKPYKKVKYDLIYTGNFSSWKGLDILIHAIRILKFDYQINTQVLLVGASKQDKVNYENLARLLEVDDCVQIIRRVKHKEIYNLLKNAKIGVIPNKYEGDGMLYTNPLKLYEYLGAGLKIVVSKLPSIQSAVPSKLVFFATPEDPQDFANTIKKALECSDDGLIEKHNFSKNFTWESRARRFSEIINENFNY